jgi:hypothetical protein
VLTVHHSDRPFPFNEIHKRSAALLRVVLFYSLLIFCHSSHNMDNTESGSTDQSKVSATDHVLDAGAR